MPAPLRFAWSRADLGQPADFVGKPPGGAPGYARVYRRTDSIDPKSRWYWTAAGTHQLRSGFEPTKREACEAAEAAWFARPTVRQ